jgi:ectoine hydroxylase-related dioxygenase (phytanoyl-CoA dioxygenase family)
VIENPNKSGPRFDTAATNEIVATFHRDGFVHIPGVLDDEEVAGLRNLTDRLMDDPDLLNRENPDLHEQRYVQMHMGQDVQTPFILRNTIELDPLFPAMLVREPILGLAESIVGSNCRFCGQNVLRNQPSVSIDRWHVDGAVHFPVPDDVPRHDPGIPPPILWITVQIALTDIDTVDHGPTQYVPGSQFSGKSPNDQNHPEFEGKGPVSVFCKAGDIYIQDPQCWHRGAPNTSDRVRYLMQSQYAVDWAYRRFGWMNRVPVDDQVLDSASDRLLQLLGQRR